MDRSLSVGFRLVFLIILPTTQATSAAEPKGDITPDNPAAVQAGIVAAFRAGSKSVVVPAGVYRIAPAHARWHLEFTGLSNFEIDARGAPPSSGKIAPRAASTFRAATMSGSAVATLQHEIDAVHPGDDHCHRAGG